MADQQVKITISAIDNATKALNDIKNNLKGVSKETDNTQQSFLTLKNAVIGFATVGLVSLGKQIIDVTKTFQELRGNIISAVGSIEKGTQTFNDLSEFAKTTQFSVLQLGRSFLTLSQNGVAPTDRLLKIFTQTAGNATNKVDALNDLTRLFARGAQGGFNIQSLNQLVANGIPAFQILREELGLDEKAWLEKRANNSVKPIFDLNVSFKNFFETIEAGLFQIGDQEELAGFVDQLTELLRALQPIIDVITLFVRNILQGLIYALQIVNPLISLFSEILSDLFIPIKAVADNMKKYLNKAFDEMARKQLTNIIDELWTKLKTSFDTILTSVSDIFTNIGSYTDDIFNNIGSSIGDILSSLSSSVGDIFSSIGGSLGDILGSVGSMFGGGGGGGGFDLGTLFDLGSMFFMAEGGAVNAGTPYTVGERGRELFIPNSDGNIIPNQDLQSKANSFNFTIVATDVKGVKELLLDNRATIVNIMNQALNSKGKPSLI